MKDLVLSGIIKIIDWNFEEKYWAKKLLNTTTKIIEFFDEKNECNIEHMLLIYKKMKKIGFCIFEILSN